MPNRILKESICASENIDQLSSFQESFFYRLIVNCDDYGRMDARPKILASRLFPLKEITTKQIEDALKALTSAELVILYEVDGKPFLQMKTWDRHQQVRAKKSKYPSPDTSNCNQMISNDIKCHRNPIQSNTNPNTESESESESKAIITDDEARKFQSEQNRVLDAAEDAGFQRSNSVRAKLINLYADHGLEKILYGIDACVKHNAPTLAYLEAVLKGEPKKQKAKVNAQDYNQRSYEEVTEEIMQEQIKDMEEFMKRSG